MELGISTGIFHEKNLLELLPHLRRAGFTTLEIWASTEVRNGERAHFDWKNRDSIAALSQKLAELGMKAHSMHAPFSNEVDVSSLDEHRRAAAVRETVLAMEALKLLGGQILVAHPASTESYQHEKAHRFAQSRKSILEIAAFAREMEITLAVENQLPHILGGDVPTLLALIEGLERPRAGLCFDTSHANLYGHQSVDQTYKQIADRVIALHVSDNRGKHDDHLIPGEGSINWPAFIHALDMEHYPGVFTLEVIAASQQAAPGELLQNLHEKIKPTIPSP
ncbi:MAG: hypothetical protein A2219_01250 [Elusimicrobia bacterium RIFOXYA2_FULL_50_26]|nr:MAG: hypothetical protein A2219_01250 [Elusimicrobia bacterium RIFOXYA2_FULL_50_26]OGS24282.1 MAG: hypothetical protein A2314_07490 [Elusimicrobia bacterium RIFOXYB2_FULL_50_12]